MTKLLQAYRQLPIELRYLLGWLGVCAPITLLKPLMSWEVYLAMLGGVTAFVLVFYVATRLVRISEKLQSSRLDKEITSQDTGPSRTEIAEKEREYKNKWLEGIEKLQKAKISLYQLPWYIVLGEPGGGKTMTLLNSGMDFPMGKDELPGFGGTRNYNWWFTNIAVILDTAGRLVFEQEGTTDRAEWEAFLKMLKRRRRCPVNGVIVALPADKLLSDDAEQRYQNACIIRDRLRQIQTQLDVRFPVFLLITKSDLVAGFTEFYNHLDSLQRNQLFGWSRPGDFSTPYDPKEFGPHFDELYERLDQLRLKFLSQQSSETELGWVYTYPEAFRALKDRIQDYIDVIFSQNIFAEPLFFRGFYFTSSLQEGRPIIEILGEHLSGEELENLEGIFPQSRAFFIHDFYTDKVAKEQGMVFRSQQHIRRMRLLKNSTVYLGVPFVIAFLAITYLGYRAYNQTVSGPRDTVEKATQLICRYKLKREQSGEWFTTLDDAGRADIDEAINLSINLSNAIEQVKHPSGMAALVFASVGTEAEQYIRQIQRQLIGYCILRPEVRRVEQALMDASKPITAETFDDFTESLTTYLDWHFGSDSGDLQELRSYLVDKSYLSPKAERQIELFVADKNNGRARLTAAITDDREYQQAVIDAALSKAQDYCLSMANIKQHDSFRWWSELAEMSESAMHTYNELLGMRQDFERAASGREFQEVAQRFLNTLQPEAPAADDTSALLNNFEIFEDLRQHLSRSPKLDDNSIKSPADIAKENLAKVDEFCAAVLPGEGAGGRYADELRERIQQMQSQAKATSVRELADFDDDIKQWNQILLERDPPLNPRYIRLKRSATDAQKALSHLATLLAPLAGGTSALQDPYLIDWVRQLQDLVAAADQPISINMDLEDSWKPQQLQRLADSISRACESHEAQTVISNIRRQLEAGADTGLVNFVKGQDDAVPFLQFPGLRNRHASSIMLKTLRERDELEQALSDAVKHDLLMNDGELKILLRRNMERYVQHYLESWERQYHDYRLAAISRLGVPRDWEEYRQFIVANAGEIWNDYEDHLDVIVRNVLVLFNPQVQDQARDAELKRQLQAILDVVDWPRTDTLKSLQESFGQATQPPDLSRVRDEWIKFEDHVDDFRFEQLGDLRRRPVIFPDLNTAERIPEVLHGEWLTSNLQLLIDMGCWTLWAQICSTFEHDIDHTYGGKRPFVFEGGQFDIDPLHLKKTLDEVEDMRRYLDRQVESHPHPVSGQLSQFLEHADRWRQFLQVDSYILEIASLPIGQLNENLQSPGQYYEKVDPKLPGLGLEGGASGPVPPLSIDSRQECRCRWRPTEGTLEIALQDPTGTARKLGAEMKPRLLKEQTRYGLFQLLQEHGQVDDKGVWTVRLSVDLSKISGLAEESAHSPECWIAFTIKFIEPQSMPAPIPWVDYRDLVGPPPALEPR